jgi:hypothetical protein
MFEGYNESESIGQKYYLQSLIEKKRKASILLNISLS